MAAISVSIWPRNSSASSADAGAVETAYPAPGGSRETLRIDAATDLEAMEPLIRDFQAAEPGVTIVYSELTTRELYIFSLARTPCCSANSGNLPLPWAAHGRGWPDAPANSSG
mgnify:CR=1 FL=1